MIADSLSAICKVAYLYPKQKNIRIIFFLPKNSPYLLIRQYHYMTFKNNFFYKF